MKVKAEMRIVHAHMHVLVNLKHLLLSRLCFSKKININNKLYYNYLKFDTNISY